MCDHGGMKSYSEDLRQKIVTAVERGTSKSETARLFEVNLSSVKRYVRMAGSEGYLAPKKKPSRTLKVDEKTERLLSETMKERPATTIAERLRFLEMITWKRLSYSTVWRLLKRLGWSRKKIAGRIGARRVAKSCLAGNGCRAARSEPVGVRRRDGHQHLPFASAGLVA